MTSQNLSVLDQFDDSIRQWFTSQFDAPTRVQQEAWPVIASGDHALITAPTGSGKTLTAFLWSLDRFASGHWQPGATRVLYISPLKALNNDIQRNLLGPLAELQKRGPFPRIQVQTRSGDTSQSDRQRMLRKPPDILITTPESLSLLLTTNRGRMALGTVETLILDEVHSMVDNRRGVSLMASAERLLDLTGNLQRIALSATVNPLPAVASYVGGYDALGKPRPVKIINPVSEKVVSLKVRYTEAVKHASENGESVWDPLAASFRDIALSNRSTLFFTNSRALAEKITLKINEQSPTLLAYAHHGSLAREIRTEVEYRLKNQELRAIVATSSLEMGIDIGNLDEVILIQSPPGIATTLQRIGRAGHGVGEVSRGVLYPVHAADFVEAAALANATNQRDLEPLQPLTGALDMLAQIIVSCCATETWRADDLYQLLKQATPYHSLPQEHFTLVLDLLAGRYAGARVRELQPRIVYNRIEGTIEARKSAVFALYNSGGSIPDRGYYQIRHADSGTKIGELDEEFVWEARTGDTFSLGTQHWQVKNITHNDVFVTAATSGTAPPFWRADRNNRSFHYAARIGEFLQQANDWLHNKQQSQLTTYLCDTLHFDALAAEKLIDYLQRQREVSGCALPHRQHLLIELIHSGPGGYRGPDQQRQLVLHTHWGGRLNHPWALALRAAWHQSYGTLPKVHADNDAVVIQLEDDIDPADVLALVNPVNLQPLLRQSLEGSGFFGARFRECAARFLLLPRQRFNQRLPLWMSRLQAKKLMSATLEFDNFPVMLEAWRTCLRDEFDLESLSHQLNAVADGVCEWTFINTASPTPFAANLAFDQINQVMYADDTPDLSQTDTLLSELSDDLIKTAVHNDNLRPQISAQINQQFINKRQRRHLDYAPQTTPEWTEWVKERVLLPQSEWWPEWHDNPSKHDNALCEIQIDERRWATHLEHTQLLIDCSLVPASAFADADQKKIAKLPTLDDERTAQTLVAEILSFHGVLCKEEVHQQLPNLPESFFDDTDLVSGYLLEDDERFLYCDADNLEVMLRWQRAARRPVFEALNYKQLPSVLTRWQQFNQPCNEQTLLDTIEQLRGYALPVSTLLQDTYACRLDGFTDHQLDSVFVNQQLAWLGTGNQQIAIAYPEDIPLLQQEHPPSVITQAFTDHSARYQFDQIIGTLQAQHPTSTDSAPTAEQTWWNAVWSGQITSDSLSALRQAQRLNFRIGARGATNSGAANSGAANSGAANSGTGSYSGSSFGASSHTRPSRHVRRSATRRVRNTLNALPGNWQLLPSPATETDALTELEHCRERVHLLLDRYGLITRELANRESDAMRWSQLFKALRVMELSGEVLQGHFIDGLSGPQFISQRALNRLMQPNKQLATIWFSALDAVSPCGLGLDWPELPQRRVGNFLAFHAGELALVVENHGKRLHFHIDAEDNAVDQVLAPVIHLAKTRGQVRVDTINAEPVRTSAYRPAIARNLAQRSDHKHVWFEQS